MDKIAGYYTGSIVSPAGGEGTTVTIPHTFGTYPLTTVKWSTTADFSVSYDETDIVNIGGLFIFSYSTTTNIIFSGYNNNATPVTIYYRIYCFLPSDEDIDVTSTQSGLDDFVINTDYNYPKVFLQGNTTTNPATITHSLGYYPQVDVWYVDTTVNRCYHFTGSNIPADSVYANVTISTTYLKMFQPWHPTTIKWYYRIYVDEN